MTRKRLLLALLAILAAIPQVLSYVSKTDDVEGWWFSRFWLTYLVVFSAILYAFIAGMRGKLSSFDALTAVFGALGLFGIVGSFVAPNGPLVLAASALSLLAMAIVFVLLREEVRTEAAHPSETTHASP